MKDSKKHLVKKWEVSMIEFANHNCKKYKITRRLPELNVAETKVFKKKERAIEQFDEWLK